MNVPDDRPPNKSALIAVIKRERKNLEDLLIPLSESQMVETGVEGEWSVKDIMAHIAAWERLAYDRLQAGLRGSPLKFPVIKGDDFVDRFNAEIYHSNRDKSFSMVKSEFEEAHTSLLNLIKEIPQDALPEKLPFDWAGKLTYQLVISSNTHWHYIEHAESIAQWLLTLDE